MNKTAETIFVGGYPCAILGFMIAVCKVVRIVRLFPEVASQEERVTSVSEGISAESAPTR
jgi:hypothetical protein